MNRKVGVERIRERLRRGESSIGGWMQIPHASIAEIMGQAQFDWVAIDLEHGSTSLHQLPDLFRALELGGTLPLARLALGDARECKQVLDAGAGGVIVPMIETAEQLKRVRDACRWPPAGTRGVAFSRANLFGKSFAAYREEAQQPLLVAMIEHVRAVERLGEILAVEGLDAVLIGPYDLSASMGLTEQFENAEFKAALEQIRHQATLRRVPCGLHVIPPSAQELKARIAEGYRFVAYSLDSVMLVSVARNPLA